MTVTESKKEPKKEPEKDEAKTIEEVVAKDKEPEKKDPMLLTLEDIREHCRLLERSVVTTESRFAVRVLRGLPATRKKLNLVVLRKVVSGFYTHSPASRDALMVFLAPSKDDMEVDESSTAAVANFRLRGTKSANTPLLPEVDAYLHLLVLLFLIDTGKKNPAVDCSEQLMVKLSNNNRRSLDHIASRCYYYHTLSHEAKDQMHEIRGFLHGKLRTATLNVS